MTLSPTGNLSIIGNFSADGDANILRDIFGGNNLDITGNFTGNQFYLEGSFFQPVNRQTVTPSGLFDPEAITFNVNKTNGFLVISNEEFQALVPGKYRIFYSVSYLDGAAQSHVFGVGLNGVFQNNTGTASSTSTANHIATPTGGGIVQVQVGDNLSVVTMDISNPVNSISVGALNFNAVRVGD